MRRVAALLLGLCASGALVGGCGTVDLGDNIVPPDLALDEDFFFCRIQPEVIEMHSCAGGGMGEGGMCHTSRSAMRLADAVMLGDSITCDDEDRVMGAVPASYMQNLEAVRFTVQSDALSSPFYRRPVGLDSHPREIFGEGDPAADLIVQWISMGAM